ncbi:MAG TPA: hypothetical protein PKA05_14000, partial [Roseiflexaceae bacterium]|nr:hypothetical protein [Roseiflexaceae bacterium]
MPCPPTQQLTPQEALPNRLIATPPNPAQQFGNAIAVAGDLLVVGAPNPGGPGAIYVFDFNGTSWNPAATIRPSDSADGDRFGTAVAIDGTRILAGAPGADSGSTRGAAYIFEQVGDSWDEVMRLSSDTIGDHFFGWSVALDGDLAAIGAPYTGNGIEQTGSVALFRHNSTTWNREQRLATGASGGALDRDLFGWIVALDGNTLVVGAYLGNRAYVFTESGGSWTEQEELTGPTGQFGYAVAIDGGTIAVGAPLNNTGGTNIGIVAIFNSSAGGWVDAGTLQPPALANGSRFGSAVALVGGTLLVG